MANDFEQVVEETQYIEGPNRALCGLARLLLHTHGANAAQWLDMPNIRLGGSTPRQSIVFDDISTWSRLSKMLAPPFVMPELDWSFTKAPESSS